LSSKERLSVAENGFCSFGIPAVRFVENEASGGDKVLCVPPLPPTYALLRSGVGTFPLKGGRQRNG